MRKVALLVSLLAIILSGCTQVENPETDIKKPERVFQLTYPVPNYISNNDFLPPWIEGSLVNSLLWRTLLKADSNLKVSGEDLMSLPQVSEDGLTVTMNLKENQKWSDGEPITMDDIIFTFRMLCGKYNDAWMPSVVRAMQFIEGYDDFHDQKAQEIAGLAVEENKLTITLSRPYYAFVSSLYQIAPIPVHVYGNIPEKDFEEASAWNDIPVNSGMYCVRERKDKEYFILEINEYFDQEAPKIEKIRVNASSHPAEDALAERCDFLQSSTRGDYDLMLSSDEYEMSQTPVNTLRFLVFNFKKSDKGFGMAGYPSFRKALVYGINWQALVEEIYGDNALYTQSGVIPNEAEYIGQ